MLSLRVISLLILRLRFSRVSLTIVSLKWRLFFVTIDRKEAFAFTKKKSTSSVSLVVTSPVGPSTLVPVEELSIGLEFVVVEVAEEEENLSPCKFVVE